jgi:hypothetical protein
MSSGWHFIPGYGYFNAGIAGSIHSFLSPFHAFLPFHRSICDTILRHQIKP